jgi:hypothetical protein
VRRVAADRLADKAALFEEVGHGGGGGGQWAGTTGL